MDANVKKKWVDALRSGKYKQGYGRLRDKNTGDCCCLGVLCEVMGYEKTNFGCKTDYIYYKIKKEIFSCSLPVGACELIGLTYQGTLMGMNDNGMTFPEIADWIEENIK